MVAEYLAKWLDYNLRQIDERALGTVDEVISLLKLVKARDVFEEFYTRGLTRRLLLKKVASLDVEKAIVARVKIECSGDMGKKADTMFKDISESEQLMKEFPHTFTFLPQFFVLEQGSWPIQQKVKTAILPPLIQSAQNSFNEFYKSRRRGKCLTFVPHMSTALILARFDQN